MRVNQSGVNSTQNSEVSSTSTARKSDALKNRKAGGVDGAKEISGTAESGASAEISSRAREAAQAKAIATKAPETRDEKIAELKKRITEGKYKVDASSVADRLVDDHLELGGV